ATCSCVPSPAHVGMDRHPARGDRARVPEPHARGDGPRGSAPPRSPPGRAPRTWGWTVRCDRHPTGADPSPTHVGMDRPDGPGECGHAPEPHARGGGPPRRSRRMRARSRGPRTWGWTAPTFSENADTLPSPTHVGMDRSGRRRRRMGRSEPHARGDGPTIRSYTDTAKLRAPRTRGMKSF